MKFTLPLSVYFSLILGIGAHAQTLDATGLAALQSTVHEMCVQPDKKGNYLHLEGDLDAGATLKVVGVNGQGKITKEDWDGISQKLDQYKTDPRACAMTIIPALIGLLRSPPAMDKYSFPTNLDPTPDGDNWLALRSQPSLSDGKRLMKMGPETLFTVFGEEGNWAHIRLRTGETGWAAKNYIACCKNAPP